MPLATPSSRSTVSTTCRRHSSNVYANGYQTATMNFQSFSQVAFAFAVTPRLLVWGLTASTAMGLLGGLLPAYRAARVPVVSALRQL